MMDSESDQFEVPEDHIPVLMQVGNGPVTVIGSIADAAALAGLLRSVADTMEEIHGSGQPDPG